MKPPALITSLHGEFEDRLGLKQGTLEHLQEEQSDWGRIIKAQGIVEANQHALRPRALRRQLKRGPLGGARQLRIDVTSGRSGSTEMVMADRYEWFSAFDATPYSTLGRFVTGSDCFTELFSA